MRYGMVDEASKLNINALYALDSSGQVLHDALMKLENMTDDIALVNVGEIEGRHAAEKIAGEATRRLSYDNLSTIMFLDPEVAAIGMNELSAQEKRIPYRVAVYGYAMVNRAIAMRATDGFVKLITSDDEQLRILAGKGCRCTTQA